MGKLLTEEQLAAFHADGFVSRIPILSRDEIERLNRKIAAFERAYPADVAWAFDIKCNLLHDWVLNAGAVERMLDAVEDLIGPNIFMTNAVFRIKEPGSDVRYDWHQDLRAYRSNPVS